MDIRQLINEKLAFLREKGVSSSRLELKILLAFVLKKTTDELYLYKLPLSDAQIKKFDRLVALRAEHYPVDKIVGRKGFYKYEFEISKDVLSPRADTEIMVEKAVNIIRENNFTSILEFGVGSGCIILSLLADTKNTTGVGIDISSKALKIAENNAISLGVRERINLLKASWFDDNISEKIGQDFDIILSNPPYIPSDEINTLELEVKNFDPLMALDGGKDGLRDYRLICPIANKLLKKGGIILLEVGEGQAEKVKEIGEANVLSYQETLRDLNGIERCIILKK